MRDAMFESSDYRSILPGICIQGTEADTEKGMQFWIDYWEYKPTGQQMISITQWEGKGYVREALPMDVRFFNELIKKAIDQGYPIDVKAKFREFF